MDQELVSMFEEYAEEKGFGPRVLHVPGVGFATYQLIPGECYIDEIYVVPAKRKSQEGSRMADAIVKIAKEKGISLLTGSVCLKANGKEKSMKALLGYGLSPAATNGDMVYFAKEI
jgi:hypothetical protein